MGKDQEHGVDFPWKQKYQYGLYFMVPPTFEFVILCALHVVLRVAV